MTITPPNQDELSREGVHVVLGKRHMKVYMLAKNEVDLLGVLDDQIQLYYSISNICLGILISIIIARLSISGADYQNTVLSALFWPIIVLSIFFGTICWRKAFILKKESKPKVLDVVDKETKHIENNP